MRIEEFVSKCQSNNKNLSPLQLENLDKYFHMLVEKNKVMNLTGITEVGEVYQKHFYDSLLISFNNNFENKSLIDVGTGAGFPGLVLAICYENLTVTLLEPLTKRCNFLQEVVDALNLKNVIIVNERSEDFALKNREKYDFATARAVARLNILAEIILPLVKVDGYFIAMKGKIGEEEADEASNALSVLSSKIEKLDINYLNGEDDKRVNIFIKKLKPTNNKYPRNYSQIKKKPL